MNDTITPVHCHFNMDTACVELLLSDATTITINTHTIEAQYAHNKHHRAELDYLLYNHPFEYAHLALTGHTSQYLQDTPDHALID